MTAAAFGILKLLENNYNPYQATSKNEFIFFYPVDYTVDIYKDPGYINLTRDIFYKEYGSGSLLTGDMYEKQGPVAMFFKNYFDAVINGKYEEYPDYFTEYYLKKSELPEKFTMQKIYDIDINLYSKENTENSESVYKALYEVRYKIRYNNGSFRSDVGSDIVKPLIFEISVNRDAVKINDIYPILTAE